MADTRKVTVEVIGGTAVSKKAEEDKNPYKEFSTDLNKMLHPVKTAETAIVGKSVLAGQSVQLAKQTLIQTADYLQNRYFTLKEDYISEQTYRNIKTTISKTTGFLTATVSGAVAGASGAGPIGAGIGAALGAIGYGIGQVFQQQARMSSYYQQLNSTNYQTNFIAQRAGLVNGTQNTLG